MFAMISIFMYLHASKLYKKKVVAYATIIQSLSHRKGDSSLSQREP